MVGILKPSKGCIKYKGSPIKYSKKFLRNIEKVNIVFQDPDKQLFYSNVYDDVAFSLRNLNFDEKKWQKRLKMYYKSGWL